MPEQIYRMSDILTPAVSALLADLTGERRARRAQHAITGRYGDILRGWAGQGELVRARLAAEVRSARLNERNTGDALRELADSEFWASLPDEPRTALGEIVLTRTKVTNSSSLANVFKNGVIPAGTRFRVQAAPQAVPAVPESSLVSVEPVVCRSDSDSAVQVSSTWQHTQTVSVRVRGALPGPGANTARTPSGLPTGALGDQLFDVAQPTTERFVAGAVNVSGGTDGVVGAQVRAIARAMARALDGPTNASAVAGCLTDPGVRRCLAELDYDRAVLRLFCADESWALSGFHAATLKQALYDYPWIGFGCRAEVLGIANSPINVRAEVVLRGAQYNAEQSTVTDAIRTALLQYFDERPDFHVWRTAALGGTIALADKRILRVASVQVVDHATGQVVNEPDAAIASSASTVTHWMLAGDGLDIAYSTG